MEVLPPCCRLLGAGGSTGEFWEGKKMRPNKREMDRYANLITGKTAGRMNDDAKPAQPKQEEPTEFAIMLPYPPSANHLYANTEFGRVLTERGRIYCDDVSIKVFTQHNRAPIRMTGRLCVNMTVHCPDKRRRDLDNIQKVVWDVLGKAGVYADDSQIDELHIYRGSIESMSFIIIGIKQINEDLEKSREAEEASQAEAAEAAED